MRSFGELDRMLLAAIVPFFLFAVIDYKVSANKSVIFAFPTDLPEIASEFPRAPKVVIVCFSKCFLGRIRTIVINGGKKIFQEIKVVCKDPAFQNY